MKKQKNFNRRQFIKQGSAALFGAFVFPTIIPSSALGNAGVTSPNDRINLGCIGLGGMGISNLKGFLNREGARVIALCDVDSEHRRAAKHIVDESYGNNDCVEYNDFRELLSRSDIDAVMIATPDHWHGIIATQAARAGKDIYGEKPLAYTISEGRAIVEAVERYGVVWQTGSWQRSVRNFRFAAELARNGRIGKVHTVRIGLPHGNSIMQASTKPGVPPEGFDYNMWLGPAPWRPYSPARCHWNFRWISDYSGGQLTDWAGHHCDIANWALSVENSSPLSIEGKADFPLGKNGLFDTPESYSFVCQYKEGFNMIVADKKQQPKGMGVHFIGDEGWIWVDRDGFDAHPKSLLKSAIRPNEIHLYKSESHYQNFLDCVRSRQKTVAPVEAAHQAIMIGHLGNIAMKLERKLYWDGRLECFINDPEADRLLSRPMRPPWHL